MTMMLTRKEFKATSPKRISKLLSKGGFLQVAR
jgi:hypothetical protein